MNNSNQNVQNDKVKLIGNTNQNSKTDCDDGSDGEPIQFEAKTFHITKIIDDDSSEVDNDGSQNLDSDSNDEYWRDSNYGLDLVNQAKTRVAKMLTFGTLLQDHLQGKGDASYGIYESFNSYITYSMRNDDYIKHLSKREHVTAKEQIERILSGFKNRIDEKVKKFKSIGPDDISRWDLNSLISQVPKSVKDEFGITDDVMTVTDLISMSVGSKAETAYNIAIALGMQNTFNMFRGARLFSSSSIAAENTNVFITHLFHSINNVNHRVGIILNSNSPAVSHFIKLFIVFMLKFKPILFKDCHVINISSNIEDGISGSVICISIDLLAGYFCKSLIALKSLIKSNGLSISHFKVSKGNFCHFLAALYTERALYISSNKDLVCGKYGFITDNEGVSLIGITVPCLHCYHPEDTSSEFIFNPNVFDPVILSTDSMYSDGNNPPVWFLDHKLGSDIEKEWLRSLIFSPNYSRAYFEFKVNDEIGNNMLQLYPDGVIDGSARLNLLYATHHSDSSTIQDEHSHIRLSLFYTLDVDLINNGGITSLLIPGHIIYFIDSVVGYIKDSFLHSRNSSFQSIRKLMIKRIKTNFSYLCLPESGSALVSCYKMYILLFWIQVLPDISDLLCVIANFLDKGYISTVSKIPSEKEVKVYNSFISKLDEHRVNGSLHKLLKDVVYNFLCLNLQVYYLFPENIKAIFNPKDECCDCNLCKSLALNLSEDSVLQIEDIITFEIINYVFDGKDDRLKLFRECVNQAESISEIREFGVLKGQNINSTLLGDISICTIKITEVNNVVEKVLGGFFTMNKILKSFLNIRRDRAITKNEINLLFNEVGSSELSDNKPEVKAFTSKVKYDKIADDGGKKEDVNDVHVYSNGERKEKNRYMKRDNNNNQNRGKYNSRSKNQRQSNNGDMNSSGKYSNRNRHNRGQYNINNYNDSKISDNDNNYNYNNNRYSNNSNRNRKDNNNSDSNYDNNQKSNNNNYTNNTNSYTKNRNRNANSGQSRQYDNNRPNSNIRSGGPAKLSFKTNDTFASLQSFMNDSKIRSPNIVSSSNIKFNNSVN